MKTISILISIIGLILTVIPSFFVWYQVISWTLNVQLMFVGMILWFVSAPFWIKTD
jgi:hypothetical protein